MLKRFEETVIHIEVSRRDGLIMGLLRDLFGASKEEVWQQLVREIVGAQYVPDTLWHGSKVQVQVNQWVIILDVYAPNALEHNSQSTSSSIFYTRLRVPYVNKDGFRFRLYRQNFFSKIDKIFGTQDIEIGDPEIDNKFVVQGNDGLKVKALLAYPRIRELLLEQVRTNSTAFYIEVKDDDGGFSSAFPAGVDELYFESPGIVTDLERLKGLYELFGEILHYLCHIGSAYESDPHITL